jgi:hypothetical protein
MATISRLVGRESPLGKVTNAPLGTMKRFRGRESWERARVCGELRGDPLRYDVGERHDRSRFEQQPAPNPNAAPKRVEIAFEALCADLGFETTRGHRLARCKTNAR